MKTLKIAALGVSALGFAALPVLGAVAVDQDEDIITGVRETVIATVDPTCGLYETYTPKNDGTGDITIEYAADHSFSETLLNGQLWNSESSTLATLGHQYTIFCNEATGWHVNAVGGQSEGVNNQMIAAGDSANIETGTATSGATANWAFKIKAASPVTASGEGAKDSDVVIAEGYDVYTEVPDDDTIVLSASAATVIPTTFTTGYQVYIGTETAADEYTGKVIYTLYATPDAEDFPTPVYPEVTD